MNAQPLHTTLLRNRATAAAGETFGLDLPVNPLSAILVTMRALNNGAAGTLIGGITDFLTKYTSWRVSYRGATIIQGSTADLIIEMARRELQLPQQGQVTRVDNDVRSLTFPLLFGWKMYDPKCCFPATRRGDLRLDFTAAADGGVLDNHVLQLETIELLDARPESFLKVTTIAQAMGLSENNDVDLPIGNKLVGALLRPFVFPTAASFNSSFGRITLRIDNVEYIESLRNWDTAHGMLARRVPGTLDWLEHTHGFVDAAAGQTNTQDASEDDATYQPYAYLDWDPLDDRQYLIDTRGATKVQLRFGSDTADGANTSRVLPVEYVELQRSQAAS